MIRDLVTGTKAYCQQRKMSIMLVSVMLLAFSFTIAFSQSSNATKTMSFRSYVDEIDNFHIVGEIENDSPSVIKYVIVMATFYDSKNQVVGTSSALTTPMDIGSGAKALFDLTVSPESGPIREIANYSIRVSHE